MRKIGYLRVSTQEQRPDRQIDALESRCDALRIETVSATSRRRPVYDALMDEIEPGDTFVVLDLDRAFRSVIDAVSTAERLLARGIGFEIVNLQVDTATPEGMYVYTVMSANAAFERQMLIKRTKEGLAAARRRGKRLGRPPKLTAAHLELARAALADQSQTLTALARQFEVRPWTLTRALERGLSKNVS
ncbi:DNA invertase Pin-like site-specific DNA recombinase [Methylorubrum rhodinum]|uniref:DNA invertase Pin-like site-specific DNA recombinase n=1 Tax=Methylorubrum rhodinum TaxID=29428 RepID=A0A840ZNP7_9HYPH|nr:recombinase family protein [Methylorubrum rhodinum]MBB5758675.1 DNA invertase Pin-like site-specific DNA recombinase [Methylorubrum rhodinum]